MSLDKYEKAKKHVTEVKEFYVHLSVYLVMAVFFVTLNLLTAPGHWWFQWPLLGWGIGVAFHGMNVFVFDKSFSDDWEEKKIRQYMGDEEYEAYRRQIKEKEESGVDLKKRD